MSRNKSTIALLAKKMTDKNPYGMISHERLLAFERELGRTLPVDYCQYLLECNGGTTNSKMHYHENKSQEFVLGSLYGLHSGSSEKQLEQNHDPRGYYDLSGLDEALLNRICIGVTTTGDLILLQVPEGSVHILFHDKPDSEYDVVQIAETFEDFQSSLVSEEEYRQTRQDSEFELRLAELKQQRAAEVRKYLRDKDD